MSGMIPQLRIIRIRVNLTCQQLPQKQQKRRRPPKNCSHGLLQNCAKMNGRYATHNYNNNLRIKHNLSKITFTRKQCCHWSDLASFHSKKVLVEDLYSITLHIFTPWKLRGLEIMGSLLGKPALSMEKGCKNHKETLCMLWINPVTFTDCRETPW